MGQKYIYQVKRYGIKSYCSSKKKAESVFKRDSGSRFAWIEDFTIVWDFASASQIGEIQKRILI